MAAPSTDTMLYAGGALLAVGAVAWWLSTPSTPPAGNTVPVPPPQPKMRTTAPAARGTPLSSALWEGIQGVADRLDMDPRHLAAIMAFESRLDPAAVNPRSGASGLIQFMRATATSLGTTVEDIRQMSALEQLPLVERYFQGFGGPFDTLQSVAMTVFYPKYRRVPPATPFPAAVQAANPGIKTPADYVARVMEAGRRVQVPEAPPVVKVLEAPAPPLPGAPIAPPAVLSPLQSAYDVGTQFGAKVRDAATSWWSSEGVVRPHPSQRIVRTM